MWLPIIIGKQQIIPNQFMFNDNYEDIWFKNVRTKVLTIDWINFNNKLLMVVEPLSFQP